MKWEQSLIEKQCETTKRLMLSQNARPETEDDEYKHLLKFTPIALEAQCVKEDGSVDLNIRNISKEEYELHTSNRQKAGERLAVLRAEAYPATLTDEKKDRAVHAFVARFSLETIKHKFQTLMKNVFKPDYAEVVAEAMRKIK